MEEVNSKFEIRNSNDLTRESRAFQRFPAHPRHTESGNHPDPISGLKARPRKAQGFSPVYRQRTRRGLKGRQRSTSPRDPDNYLIWYQARYQAPLPHFAFRISDFEFPPPPRPLHA
jgi:hypothetical protein